MDREANLVPSSPSASSLSSSDLDTESTGSFFPDRSTSLGTLMGVTFPDLPAGPAQEPPRRPGPETLARKPERGPRRRHRRGRSWWRFCRDDMGVPTSLGDFLQIERRLSGACGDVGHGDFVYGEGEMGGAGEALFEDGRVLPPATATAAGDRRGQGAVSRLPVLLTGICSGGEG